MQASALIQILLVGSAAASCSPAMASSKPGHASSLPSAASVLRCDEPVYDFGTVWAGRDIYHEFKITNTGPDIVWFRVVEGCACLRAAYRDDFWIAPGETIAIPTWVETAYIRGIVWKNISVEIVQTEPATRPAH